VIARPDTETLLTDQAIDLVRYRALVEAQVAVLFMAEASLLDQLGHEADGLLDQIVVRDRQIGVVEEAGPLAELSARVERARSSARLATNRLIQSLRRESARVASDLELAGRESAARGIGYPMPRQGLSSPLLVDRSA
jgi:hypothetical protein